MKRLLQCCEHPYRVFFPAGILSALFGVGIWLPLIFQENPYYPMILHRHLMVGGFLLSFVIGFLCTALPRFTKTSYLSLRELSLLVISQMMVLVFCSDHSETEFYFSVSLSLLILIGVLIRRFLKRQENPPSTFLFLGMGLLGWEVSSLILGAAAFWEFPDFLLEFSRKFFYEGAPLFLVVGVGGRLIPGILGWQEIVSKQRELYEKPLGFLKVLPRSLFLSSLVLFLAYVLYGLEEARLGGGVRTLVILYFSFFYWRLHRLPPKKNPLTFGIWISSWCFLLGSALPILWSNGGIHALHTIYIGGFSLLVILIATRVIYSHREARPLMDQDLPIFSFGLAIFLIFSTMLTRVLAWVWPEGYLHHLSYAAFLWVLGVGIWLVFVIFRVQSQRNE